jgi:hypothetical protein
MQCIRTTLPTRRGRSFARPHRQSARRWRSCCCSYRRVPAYPIRHHRQQASRRSTHLDVLVCHADVLRIGLQILRRGHDGELNRPLIAERLVCPLPHRADLLDCGDTVVRNEHLRGRSMSAHTSNARSKPLPYICDDRVSIVRRHKVLDLARRRMAEFVPSDKVRRKIELGCVRARGAIGIPVSSVLCSAGHVVCRNSHALWEVSVWGEEEVKRGRGSGCGSVRDRSIFHGVRAPELELGL